MSEKLYWAKKHHAENTGGGCIVDIIELQNGLTVCISDEYVGLYRDPEAFWEDGNELEGFWMTRHTKCPVATENEVEALADEALDAACKLIQDRIGQTDGGIAGFYFSGEEVQAKLCGYIRAELKEKGIGK